MTGSDMATGTDPITSSAAGPDTRSSWGAAKRISDRTPLRTKLITAVLVLVIMALAAISVASMVMLRGYVTTQNDGTLQGALNRLNHGATLPITGDAEPFAQGSDLVVAIQPSGKQVTWQPRNGYPNFGGAAYSQPLPELPTGADWASTSRVTLINAPAQSGPDSWRVIAESVTDPTTKETATLIVASPLGNINAMTTRLVVFDLIVGGAIVIVLAAVAIGVVRANLRPLNDIELTAGQIAAGHLDHRVPEGDPRTEIGSLGRSLNAMLTQIETAFHAQQESEQAAHQSEERMRRFIADASHELRTPLTTIRGFAAHYRQRGGASLLRWRGPVPDDSGVAGADQNSAFRTSAASSVGPDHSPGTGLPPEGMSPGDLDHLVGRVEAEATRMGLLVEDLLTLARLDQQRPLAKAPVDLLTLAADAVQDARIVSPGRPIDLIVAPGTAFLVDGDEARLRQVLSNLVNNAITHTPAGTPVRVKIARGTLESRWTAGTGGTDSTDGPGGTGGTTGTAGLAAPGGWGGSASAVGTADAARADAARAARRVVSAVVLDVVDDGPGMTADQAQRVFERFYRADAARNRASGGTGLGLAIVAGLVSAHGGTVSVRTVPGQGADFQVKLPLSPDALAVDDADDSDALPG
ncbi:MAG: sensor histidine kinase [Trebonia sp.]